MATATKISNGIEISILKITEIEPGDNYRKTTDKKKMQEMIESVKAQDVIEPIIVRRKAKGKGYEIIDGQRRWMAAKSAGKKTIMAVIRNVSDAEALEIALTANTQGEDANPMEEAIAYKRLLEMGNHTSQTLAARTGNSVAYVTGRLKLNALPKEAQKKILDGTIGIGHALLLTRLKNADDMVKLLDEIIYSDLTVEEADNELGHYSTNMSHARFDTNGCATCPARSRAQTLLFPESAKEDDTCFDRSCFFAKNREHMQKFAEELERDGANIVVDKNEVRKLTSSSSKNTCLINIEKGEVRGLTPKNKKKCLDCTQARAFYWFEQEIWGGTHIESGWICLDKKCLDKMNQKPGAKQEDTEQQEGASLPETPSVLESRKPIHAELCRDRWARPAAMGAVAENETIAARIVLFVLLKELDGDDEDYAEIMPKSEIPSENLVNMAWSHNEELYPYIELIPADKLSAVISATITRLIQKKLPAPVLVNAVLEAGVDLNSQRLVDDEYLQSFSKDQLIAIHDQMGLSVSGINKMKKGAMIEAIMAQDLTGKFPSELNCLIRPTMLDGLGDEEDDDACGPEHCGTCKETECAERNYGDEAEE